MADVDCIVACQKQKNYNLKHFPQWHYSNFFFIKKKQKKKLGKLCYFLSIRTILGSSPRCHQFICMNLWKQWLPPLQPKLNSDNQKLFLLTRSRALFFQPHKVEFLGDIHTASGSSRRSLRVIIATVTIFSIITDTCKAKS